MISFRPPLLAVICLLGWNVSASAAPASPSEPGLLFYLSGSSGTTADVAFGQTAKPNFDAEITTIKDGAKGDALSAGNTQRLAYWAPGNIYAQRGTLSFYWRSRDPVGPTEFPVFRVAYADSSIWDMTWLRIDYNGHGFDAYVTDASLSRIRVSVPLQPFPSPKTWIHLTLGWDETKGIRFYIDGKLAATKETKAILYTGLDQFGPHSRIISPNNVQSDYNYVRGGDLDEVRIYDRMLTDDQIATLATGAAPANLSPLPPRSLTDAQWRDEWWYRYGWNRKDDPPPYLEGSAVSIRKVEITDAFDLKRWWWKATDGIRETTWPGVYNRSRLPGRNDYFQLPDWDCYVESGKAITFLMPEEPWNHLEISGAAWGTMSLLNSDDANDAPARSLLFERPKGQEKTVHQFAKAITAQKIRFTNVEQEQPIGELSAYNVTAGKEPAGTQKIAYRLTAEPSNRPSLDPLFNYIKGRFAPDERATLIATPAAGTSVPPAGKASGAGSAQSLPLVHVLIPNESGADKTYQLDGVTDGLDGIALDLPALDLAPTHGDYIPLNIRVKDPLWIQRDMLDFTFSVKPHEAKTLWLDLRDRILPPGKAIYLTIASASGAFGPASLAGAEVRLIFKPRKAALVEHELDRFTQARDNYAMLVEEHPHSAKFNLWNRFEGDITDLMRVNPNHWPGRDYYADGVTGKMPTYVHPDAPAGVPLWAFRQVELLKRVKNFVEWYIDNRQVPYGDFGGGISDDDDFTNMWPAMAFMGVDPEKLTKSLHALLEACYKNGMFTNGLSTIQADELHSFEEGIECLGADMVLNYGDPKQIERAMETQRGVEGITGINSAGHRHIRTSYYNGLKMATEGVWGWSKPASYLVLQPGYLLVEYNGNPQAKKVVLELADGLIAHRKKNEAGKFIIPSAIQYATDAEAIATRGSSSWPLFWAAWKWTADKKYLDPIFDGGPAVVTAINGNAIDILGLRAEFGPKLLDEVGNRRGPLESQGAPNQPTAGRAGDPRPRGGPSNAYEGRGSPRNTDRRATASDQFKWQLSGDKKYLEELYTAQIDECELLKYIDTEGSLWIDRVGMPYAELQRGRLGGTALVRGGSFPGHTVSWNFRAPANEQSVAILVPDATPTAFKVIVYNLSEQAVHTTMTGWNVEPGIWEMTQGIDLKGNDTADEAIETRTLPFERTRSVDLTLAPRITTVLTFKLKTKGTPYWTRPDLGLGREDIVVKGAEVQVRVHSLGSVPAPASTIVFRDHAGAILATAKTPALAAPVDLKPKTADVTLALPANAVTEGGSVEIDPDHAIEEITTVNNVVRM